ncbi:MAG TPA: tripartite tricarboxylate transporter substrate binding protein [Pseudolabrys sp.]|nr:tripartite tricarboxylate transporter substrate binding protein [Pseudolabrys sp.]
MRRTLAVILSLSSLLAISLTALSPARAQTYPNRNITIVVPFPAGGLTDIPVRLLAQIMQDKLKVNVVVENKPGGSGVIGASYVLRSDPDGYTLLANAVADTQNLFYMKIPYNAAKDFKLIAKIVDGPPLVMLVNRNSPFKTVADVIAEAKAHPEKVSFGTSGYATSPFIALNEMNILAGVKIEAVPFHSTGDATAALISGAIQGMFTAASTGRSMVDGGQVRALAVAGPTRLTMWPDVPTMQESGFADFNYNGFVGLTAPAKVSPEVVAVLNKAVNDAIHSELFETRMAKFSMTVPDTAKNKPEDYQAFFEALTARQGTLAKSIRAMAARPAAK